MSSRTSSKFLSGIVLCLATIGSVNAEDTLLSLMQKLKSAPLSRISYQETRTLKLMTEPWHGSGYLYSLPPDLMIREQLQPQRLLMGVKGNKALYFDPKENVRHQGDLDGDNELSVPLTVFKALVNADETLLRSLYDIDFSSESQAWSMNLTPKQKTGSVSKIVVSGLSGQQANKISITQEDGDVSKFSLQKDADGAKNNGVINKLYQELLGE
ncbi:MAG: outer membrane lipoprotein carrier protein LolA [Methylococcales bacterium]|nr:outer membrane lipoprotein carrier protein LolA [Methylococcales bacterium]